MERLGGKHPPRLRPIADECYDAGADAPQQHCISE